MVAAVAVNSVKNSVGRAGSRYQLLFDMAPIALWEQDVTLLGEWLNDLRSKGVEDIVAHMEAHPELIEDVLDRIVVTDVNQAAAELVGVPPAAKSAQQRRRRRSPRARGGRRA